MYEGKLVFAQLIDHLPMHTFRRTVARFGGDRWVKSFSCQDQFRAMAFAQLTYRESLRDIEICLSAQSSKLYHMGLREPVRRSTLADANETRPWRIYAEFARSMCSSPSSRSASTSTPRSTLCYRFSRSRSSRKCPFYRPFRRCRPQPTTSP